MKNTLAILVPVYTTNIEAMETPIKPEKIHKKDLAFAVDIELILELKYQTKPIGASMKTYIKGVPKISDISAGEFATKNATKPEMPVATAIKLKT